LVHGQFKEIVRTRSDCLRVNSIAALKISHALTVARLKRMTHNETLAPPRKACSIALRKYRTMAKIEILHYASKT
jgi:hypothetical protein